jgi:hypothetical protein
MKEIVKNAGEKSHQQRNSHTEGAQYVSRQASPARTSYCGDDDLICLERLNKFAECCSVRLFQGVIEH